MADARRPARATSATGTTAFDVVLAAGEQPVLRYLRSRLDSADQAREAAQETFVRAYAALARGEQPRQPVAWLLAIAHHVLLETWRAARYRRQLTERVGALMGPGWQSPW